MKKKLLIISLLLFVTIGFLSNNCFAVKIKYHGSGGLVVNPDGSHKICPTQGDALCAVVELTVWQAIKEGWKKIWGEKASYPNPSPDGINKLFPIDSKLFVYDNKEVVIATYDVQVEYINNPPILKSESDIIEINTSDIKISFK